VVKCHKLLKTSTNLYLVFDQLKGNTLEDNLRNSSLSLPAALNIYQEVLTAIAYLQSQNISHGQLEPNCIVLLEKGGIKITSFGFAEEVTTAEISLSEWHSAHPKTDFTPPEVQNLRLSLKSDIFSLGVILAQIIRLPDDEHSRKHIDKDKLVELSRKMTENIP
jgi:serine/threonine protein kinase